MSAPTKPVSLEELLAGDKSTSYSDMAWCPQCQDRGREMARRLKALDAQIGLMRKGHVCDEHCGMCKYLDRLDDLLNGVGL